MQLCADPLALPHDLLNLPPGPRLALANQSRHTTASIRSWSPRWERPLGLIAVSPERASAPVQTHFHPGAGLFRARRNEDIRMAHRLLIFV